MNIYEQIEGGALEEMDLEMLIEMANVLKKLDTSTLSSKRFEYPENITKPELIKLIKDFCK